LSLEKTSFLPSLDEANQLTEIDTFSVEVGSTDADFIETDLIEIDLIEKSIVETDKQNNNVIFEAKDLCWQVDSYQILKNLNFEIKKNQFIGLIGPNGAGKSSLLRCLYGKHKLSSGLLNFKNKKINQYSRRELAQKIAVVVQEPPTHFDMNVFEVVSMGLIPHRSLFSLTSDNDKKLIVDAISSVELSEKENAAFNTLSGGEKQRVMVARAIVQQPQILLLDEPTNHLDIQHQIEVLRLAKNMSITVVLSIHDLNMAANFCDQLILLDQGKIVSSGTSEEVLTSDNLKEIFHINAKIDANPFHNNPRITFNFNSDKNKNEKEA